MNYQFHDLIDTAALGQLLEKLYHVARIPSAIIDMEGNILTGAGWQRICTDFHRKHADAEKICIASDTCISDKIKAGEPYVVYECPHGLVDSCCPVVIEGEHVANVFTGQMLHTPVNEETRTRFRRQAARYGFNERDYLEALSEVPVFPLEKHKAILDFLSDFARQVAVMGLTNLKALEQSRILSDSDNRFRLLMDSLDALVYVADMDTHEVLFVNKYCRDLLGDITGKICWENIQKGQSGPCDFCTNSHLLDAEGKPGEVYTWEFQNTVAKKWFLIRDRAIEWPDGRIVRLEIATDITARKEAEEALQASESQYRAVVEDQAEFVGRFTREGILTFVNPALARFEGKRAGDLLGTSFYAFIHEKDREETVKAIEALGPENPSCIVENRVQVPGVEELWAQWSHRAILDRQGEIIEYQAVGRDITERKLIEEEKNLLEKRLLQAQKMEAIGTMAGGIAHDFNNILAIILANADLARLRLTDSSPVRDELAEVVSATHRAKNIVKQILAFSRRARGEKRLYYLCRLISSNMKTLRATIPTTVEVAVDLPLKCHENITDCRQVLVDPTQIHQLLLNLCANAVQAMDEKGLLQITLREVSISAGETGKHPGLSPGFYELITLSDTGCGMDEKTMQKIYDPFFTTKEPGKGTGMGMSVVHGIVKTHGAKIFVESTPGKGTAFHIYFPVSQAGPPDHGPEVRPLATGSEHILFVDDEERLAEIAGKMLRRTGYTVTTATGGPEALETFLARSEEIDAVVTDQTMPRMTGTELAERILEIRPDLPIILCTGYSNLVSEEETRKRGIKKICMKPLGMEDLAAALREVLDGAGPAPSLF